MHDWNVVISVREDGYTRARQLLQRYGPVYHTDYYNVLVMKVDDIPRLLEELRARVGEDPSILAAVARVLPAVRCFDFRSHDDFEARAREAALAWVPELAHKSFHVRLHRRGLKEQLPRPEEERSLDQALLEALERAGTPGRISFEDPDAILAVETVGHRAGLGLWTREDLGRYPFLRPD
jgi:tRNA(Ser,Leu) C12 N-acetylase TAN1